MADMGCPSFFATLQPSTAVSHVVGPIRFTSEEHLELVVAWSTRLEVYRIGAGGEELHSVAMWPVHGRILVLQSISLPGAATDCLLLVTEKGDFALLGGAAGCAGISSVVRASGLLRGAAGGLAVEAVSDSPVGGHLAVLGVYEGQLHVIDTGALAKLPADAADAEGVKQIRQESVPVHAVGEARVLDVKFLRNFRAASHEDLFALLYVGTHSTLHLSLFGVKYDTLDCDHLSTSELGFACKGRLAASHVMMPLPRPWGGLLVLGAPAPQYWDGRAGQPLVLADAPLDVVAAVAADEARLTWFVATAAGGLWLLQVRGGTPAVRQSGGPPDLFFERLGGTAPVRSLACWSGCMLLLGSRCADASVLRVSSPAPGRQPRALQVLETWPNLGPIVDFCLADLDACGRAADLVSCSGAGAWGSLRALRVGLGVNEFASVPGFEGAMGLWALPCGSAADAAAAFVLLLVSFAVGTRAFRLQGGQLTDVAADGLIADVPTLSASPLAAGLLQVHAGGAVVVDARSLRRLAAWQSPPGELVTVAAASQDGALVALAGGSVLALRFVDSTADGPASARLGVAASWQLRGEVSALCCSGDVCVAGLWAEVLCTWSAAAGVTGEELLPAGTIVRCLAVAALAGRQQLLAALSDGSVAIRGVRAEPGERLRRITHLGPLSAPLLTCSLGPAGHDQVFLLGQRPCVLRAIGDRQLSTHPVNLRHISHAANVDVMDGSPIMAFIAAGRLVLGGVEQAERVHVETVALGMAPQCLCWHAEAALVAVGCCADGGGVGGGGGGPRPAAVDCVRVFEGPELLEVQSLPLEPRERVHSICVAALGGATPCIAVGTSFLPASGEAEACRGRVLVYQVGAAGALGGPPLALLAELCVDGTVYALAPLHGSIAGTVGGSVRLWRLLTAPPGAGCYRLDELASSAAEGVEALHELQVVDDCILVGDVRRSVRLLRYRGAVASPGRFEEVAHDSRSSWVCAMQLLDASGRCLCFDDACNMITLSPSCGSREAEVGRPSRADGDGGLRHAGQMHAGELVNRLRRLAPDGGCALRAAGATRERVLWASVDGAWGVAVPALDEATFARYSQLQDLVERETRGDVILPHQRWRDAQDLPPLQEQLGGEPAAGHSGILDGDVLGRLLWLPRDRQEAVVARARDLGVHLEGGADGLLHELLELSRL